ncbi:SubName: Full=Uncharacterized protein {ECO:0000313/EMBL:CCA74433.1} [Serendipita indica DSM 11827]|uniref:Uncharacterized protein n=1 Tax=Serendipita indica (strain DSM 11827) TaxID=1109443 RepID=G4TSZ0_SERID|nr:SubName: Full=Uncharacterized protein {ECO:0000313/EMBL:CCA74433.1} [Serendipita indica DSM 11827]CCA74433.1 hypothetical protein PIIN_08386 [Serendipita indica DSM 11827]
MSSNKNLQRSPVRSGLSKTLATALMLPNRTEQRPSPYVITPAHVSSTATPYRTQETIDNERYYQAQIAHLQTALMREHALFVRSVVAASIISGTLLLFIGFLLLRPAKCDHVGHRIHIPIFSPWTSSHEKEHLTSSGWGFSTIMLFPLLAVLAWQNRDTLLIPVFELLAKQLPTLRRLFIG